MDFRAACCAISFGRLSDRFHVVAAGCGQSDVPSGNGCLQPSLKIAEVIERLGRLPVLTDIQSHMPRGEWAETDEGGRHGVCRRVKAIRAASFQWGLRWRR
jgi:hypothetical protein